MRLLFIALVISGLLFFGCTQQGIPSVTPYPTIVPSITPTPTPMFNATTTEQSKQIAENFAKNEATFKFDGSGLKYDSYQTLRCPFCWQFTFNFTSSHAGYGDRAGKMLAQVITPHQISITVSEGKVTNAFIDELWDGVSQKEVAQTTTEKTDLTIEKIDQCLSRLPSAYLTIASPSVFEIEAAVPGQPCDEVTGKMEYSGNTLYLTLTTIPAAAGTKCIACVGANKVKATILLNQTIDALVVTADGKALNTLNFTQTPCSQSQQCPRGYSCALPENGTSGKCVKDEVPANVLSAAKLCLSGQNNLNYEGYNPNSKTYWFTMENKTKGCSPACVVNVNGTYEINYRCTGALLP